MSNNLSAAEARLDGPDPIKILEYPKELTLMTKYMNEVQAKQFRDKNSFRSFFSKGLNLTVLNSQRDEA